MAKQTFNGITEDAQSLFLGSEFWKKGSKIEGVVTGEFTTSTGKCYNITLNKPVTVKGEKTDKVSIGGLKGLAMALRASGANEFQEGDAVIVECTGTTPTDKGNDQINFKVLVNREKF